jgi:hypothetical protein
MKIIIWFHGVLLNRNQLHKRKAFKTSACSSVNTNKNDQLKWSLCKDRGRTLTLKNTELQLRSISTLVEGENLIRILVISFNVYGNTEHYLTCLNVMDIYNTYMYYNQN